VGTSSGSANVASGRPSCQAGRQALWAPASTGAYPRLITMHSQTHDLASLPPQSLTPVVVAVLAAGQIATFDIRGAMLCHVVLGSDVAG
jgi:hypothetical protein